MKGKQILQQTCRDKLGWDDEISDDIKIEWKQWLDQLNDLCQIQVKRCIKPEKFGLIIRTELHHFSDASQKGYGACSYVRFINEDGQVHCTLLLAKSRVAPLKQITIPRIELQGATVAVKLSQKLQQELKMDIDEEYFWCDSEIVLGYINNEARRFHTYVANRVQQIRNLSSSSQWNHISTNINPADMASRGVGIKELTTGRWFQGPQFLWEKTLDIRKNHSVSPLVNPYDPEIKKVTKVMKCASPDILDTHKFSDWNKLVKACTLVRLIGKHRKWKRHTYSAEDLAETESILVKLDQKRHYSSIMQELTVNKLTKANSAISKLSPFLDATGTLRVGSRATKSSALTTTEKQPSILHKDSYIAKLLIAHYHNKVHHQGRIFTQAALRQAGYWIVGAQKLIKAYIYKCVTCRHLRGKHASQLMGDLPQERVELSPPFTHVGVDTFGHFIVKERRSELKRWCIVFSCMYSRAIHIEVVNDLSTDSFLQALRRLQSIRGPVTTIFSDAGTNFMGAKNLMAKDLKTMNDSSLKELVEQNQIRFKTNTPGASHQGGVWEREIRTIRAIFGEITRKYDGRMDTEALRTSMYEVMYTINSKPLTVDHLDSPDEVVITPNHLLTAKSSQLPPPPGKIDNQVVYGKTMYQKTQQMAEEYWKHWQDYLTKIEIRQKWKSAQQNVKVGDMVSVIDDNVPRNQWKLGIVESVQPGVDGLVRKATVRLANNKLSKSGKQTVPNVLYERPIQKLIPILST